MSAVRYPTVLKTSTFSIKDRENTFKYVCYLSNSATKLSNILEMSNNSHKRIRAVQPKLNSPRGIKIPNGIT